MKTDRELLELAAKAVGLTGGWTETIGGWPALAIDGNVYKVWQPLHDDGDALRLAVKLEMDIGRGGLYTWVIWLHRLRLQNIDESDKDNGNDPCAATRRAIVRAAAAIGEAMP